MALDRTRTLLRDDVRATVVDGYLDTIRETAAPPITAAQRAMQWTVLPKIYEAVWRPIGFAAWSGGRTTGAEQRVIDGMLDLKADDVLLDIACGPGNTTRRQMHALGPDGLAVGFDFAPTMLARAVEDTHDERVAFVRGDARSLPFPDGSFDAVTCMGALYLIDDPHDVIAEMARVLKPGGRALVLTSCSRGPLGLRLAEDAVTWPSGLKVFRMDEVTRSFAEHGLADVEQDVRGFMQIVVGTRPG